MSLNLYVEADIFKKLPTFLDNIQHEALPKANRRALNRSLTTLKKNITQKTRLHYKLKAGELKRDFLRSYPAKGNDIRMHEAKLIVSGRPVSLLRFLPKGKRKPVDQKGKSVRQRRPLRVEIKPGVKKATRYFVQKGTGGKNVVFARKEGRKKNGRAVIAKQSAPGLPFLFKRVKSITLRSTLMALRQYERDFERDFDFFVRKAMSKL